MSNDNETKCDVTGIQASDAVPPSVPNPPDPPQKRKRKPNKTKPLDSPEDEAIAQYLASPKSIREFKSITDLAQHFNISRQTVYRRTQELYVLERAEWLLTHHKLAGDLTARLHWKRIVAGQVKAAVSGDTRAAQFCKDTAWPEEPPPVDIWKP